MEKENQKKKVISQKEEKHRIFGLDIMRVVCAGLIYARHSVSMYGCNYGESLNWFFENLTSPVMTCFFILSGFSLYYVNRNHSIFEGNSLLVFYIKRMVSVLPVYYLVHMIWLIFNRNMLSDWLFLTPVEILGIQSAYNTLFGILHNGGTWFVSCIIVCYFIYPLVQEILVKISIKLKWIMFGVVYFICVYSNFVVTRFSLNGNYSNLFFRAMEFIFGVALASILTQITDWKKVLQKKRTLIAVLLFLFILLIVGGYYKFGFLILFKVILCMPIIAVMVTFSYFIRSKYLENNRVLVFLSTISYYFFLIQLFVWKLSSQIMALFNLSRNRYKIIVSFSLCFIISILIYEFFDKPIRKKTESFVKSIK